MKKLFLLLLLLPLLGRGLGGGLLFAQNVTVSNLVVTAGTPSTVTFDVSWERPGTGTVWMDSAWVFVDYNNAGRMARLPLLLSSGATLTETSAPGEGALEEVPGNTSGAWVKGYAWTDGSFSATVQLLTAKTEIAGACAYASGYPPVGAWLSDSKITFTGTPMYEITLILPDGSTTVTVEAGGTFLLPCSYTISSFTDRTGAPGIIKCVAATGLTLEASSTLVCPGESTTLTASAGGAASYSLNGTLWQAEPEFEVSPTSTTYYTLYAQTEKGCVTSVTNAATVTTYPAVSPGAIPTATANATAGVNPPNITITSETDATGGGGSITYEWRRTGTGNATLTGSAATYAIGSEASNYTTAGTYYFNRYAKDATCNSAWVAATGTYTLNLEEGPFLITSCPQCCWDGFTASTWVDCFVTANMYPFNSTTIHTDVTWAGGSTYYYPGAISPEDGRANFTIITADAANYTPNSAIGICKDLGPGWYLPAYEELYNMRAGGTGATSYGNKLAGAGIITTANHWSSTEYQNNGGRYSSGNLVAQAYAVVSDNIGPTMAKNKSNYSRVRCAWRPPDPALTPKATTICVGQSVILTAEPAGAVAYSIDGIAWQSSNTFSVTPDVTTTYPLHVQAADGSTASVTVASVVTVNTPPSEAPTGLISNVTTICDGIATPATLTATGGSVGSGAVYEWGTGSVGSNSFTATAGSTCSVSPNAATTYWVRLRGDGACSATVTGGITTAIDVYPVISPGAIPTATANITAGVNPPDVTIGSLADASGGSSGSITYEWRRTGASTATLTGSAATYAISADASNHTAGGTYYFNRYAKDATCNTAWVAATGTYTLNLEEGPLPVRSCPQCCWDGFSASTWVDCYVTANAYPFSSTTTDTGVNWESSTTTYASSHKDGRTNTDGIFSSTITVNAVQICKDLGPGWYLPAYDELINMSNANSSSTYPPLNKRTGANLLASPSGWYWSSTGYSNNGGDYYITSTSRSVVVVNYDGPLSFMARTNTAYVRCVWRTPDPALTPKATTICEGQSVILTAEPAGAAAYNIGEGWQSSNTFSVSPSVTTTYPLYVQAADGSTASVTVASVVTVNTPPSEAPTSLISNVTTICAGIATPATLTATGGSVGSGAVYEWGTGSVGSNSFTTTAGSTCSVSPDAATTYWVRLRGTGACSATVTGGITTAIDVYPVISPGEIDNGTTNITAGINPPEVTITSVTEATGGNGSITYEWRRTGASTATLTGSATTYALSADVSNYTSDGTYYFNRYAKDATCSMAATGTYTLTVAPGTVTFCPQCCWDGFSASTWVDCFVTANAVSTGTRWSEYTDYYPGASSDKDGRANTEAILTYTPASAVGLCKGLGMGWYLPAYEELYNMRTGAATTYGNQRAGIGVLTTYWHWSSTEYYGNVGRYNNYGTNFKDYAVVVNPDGDLGYIYKTGDAYRVHCAWRPPDPPSFTPDATTICAGQSATLTASPTGAASYSIDGTAWQSSNTFSVNPDVTTTYPLYVQAGDGSPASVTMAAATVTVNPIPTGLTLEASSTLVCPGESTTLTASAAGAASYSLNGTVWQASPEFEVFPTSTTYYTLYAQTESGCSVSANNAATVTTYPAISPGAITPGTANITAGINPPEVTITSVTEATGGDGSITYEWRRTGKSSATLTGSAATYAIGSEASNYAVEGTYYFNRYAKDATCSMAATGTYTLTVAPGTVTFCEKCCWDCAASTWVDCYATKTAVTPGNNSGWTGNGDRYYPDATSDRDGRANTEYITTSATYAATSAVGICKGLGDGWYLPAYEELVNMGNSETATSQPATTYPPLNKLGAGILTGMYHFSSTEYVGNGHAGIDGRYTGSNQNLVVLVINNNMLESSKPSSFQVRCVWRPLDNSTVSPGAITDGTAVTGLYADPGLTITSAGDATGGSGSVMYMWVRSGTSSATLTGSAATYDFSNDADNYAAAGTYAFNRYAKDGPCSTQWVASAGTYTLTVFPVSAAACPQCCYDGIGEVWTDCYVYSPGGSIDHWSGNALTYYPGAISSKNGRANAEAIASSTTTANAVQTCKDLGAGWYLPAYEELAVMFDAQLTGFHDHWSSTEWFNNDGSHKATNGTAAEMEQVVLLDDGGNPFHTGKDSGNDTRTLCAWRTPDPALTPKATTVCAGQSVILTAEPAGAASYSIGEGWQSSNTFSVSPSVTTTYPLHVQAADGSTASVTAAAVVTIYSAFTPGAITDGTAVTPPGTNPDVTIADAMPASGGNNSITYQWRRTGTSSETLTGDDATYSIGSDASNYTTAGTYYFNRYAKDGACSTTWVASAGTYTLGVKAGVCSGNADFCTSSTWNVAGHIWSDRVVALPASCSQVYELSFSVNASPPAEYKISSDSGVERYYYNWTCAQTVCPSGWSLPTQAQFEALASALMNWDPTGVWDYGGFAWGDTVELETPQTALWSSSEMDTGKAYYLWYDNSGYFLTTSAEKWYATQVRCVKD